MCRHKGEKTCIWDIGGCLKSITPSHGHRQPCGSEIDYTANISVCSIWKLLQVLKSAIGITNSCKLVMSNTATGNDRLPFVSRLISYICRLISYIAS